MTEENFQDEAKRAHSVPRNGEGSDSGLSVNASPFNPVKLELGFILLIGFFLLLVIHRITDSAMEQLAVLGIYGLAGMTRLIYRTRQVQANNGNEEE